MLSTGLEVNPKPTTRRRADRLSIGVAMLLVAGAALGLSLVADELSRQFAQGGDVQPDLAIGKWDEIVLLASIYFLGGLSLVGPPLLLLTARKRAWGAGRLLWFAQGTASWLLWPPFAYRKIVSPDSDSFSGTCYYYGTPLMAVYVTLALLAGGRLKRSRRRRIYRSWQETFGLFLGLAWACTGLYLIALFYRHDFFKR
jgi:hypothetical protein